MPRDLLLVTPAAEVGELEAVECTDRVACVGDTRRVWFVASRRGADPYQDAGPELRALFAARYQRTREHLIDKGTIALYERIR
jgi:mannosyltransferase